jgi:protein-glutamine gamma-glutamyltransferase
VLWRGESDQGILSRVRFGLTHRLATGAFSTLGVVSLVGTGAVGAGAPAGAALLAKVGVLLALAASLALPDAVRRDARARAAARGLVAAGLLVVVALSLPSAPLGSLLAAVLVAAQLERLATGRGADHDPHIHALSVVQFLVAAVVGGGALQGACLLAAAFLGPPSLWLSHLRRHVEANSEQGARDRAGMPVDVPRILRSSRVVEGRSLGLSLLLSLGSAAVVVILFLALPRGPRFAPWLPALFPSLLPRNAAGDRVDLGSLAPVRQDSAVVLRAEAERGPLGAPIYFRRSTLGSFDGRTWSPARPVAVGAAPMAPGSTAQAPPTGVIRVALSPSEAGDGGLLPVPDRAVRVWLEPDQGAARVEPAGAGQWRLLGAGGGELRYLVETAPAPAPERSAGESEAARYLSLPARPATLGALAHAWTAGAEGPLARAAAIEARLRGEYAYDLSSPSRGSASPLEHFLLESRRGHCELFASSMAVLLREVGVPSRVVVGYVGSRRWGRSTRLLVRGADAHAWVEALVEGQGWVRFDPTPPAAEGATAGAWGLGSLAPLAGLIERAHAARDALDWSWASHVDGYRGPARSAGLTRPAWSLAPVAALAALGVVALRARRSRPDRAARPGSEPGAEGAAVETARTLYAALEQAMAARGLARPAGVPPLQHALCPAVAQHPSGPAILALTEVYQRARFGGEPLDAHAQRRFLASVHEIEAAGRRPGAGLLRCSPGEAHPARAEDRAQIAHPRQQHPGRHQRHHQPQHLGRLPRGQARRPRRAGDDLGHQVGQRRAIHNAHHRMHRPLAGEHPPERLPHRVLDHEITQRDGDLRQDQPAQRPGKCSLPAPERQRPEEPRVDQIAHPMELELGRRPRESTRQPRPELVVVERVERPQQPLERHQPERLGHPALALAPGCEEGDEGGPSAPVLPPGIGSGVTSPS